ncbi:unnamed protein product [Clonostachys rosea f. rosea IK726]|uniref:Heterokaryon incompatibility domain-containing protein n=2 Tax=Bionectria ochroleuca TaxID=29856 RepID=A0A0B7K2Y9_BIOOC|nr:unnamed protein product [Clonostachys rosea f. rosea IK726]
MAADTNPQFHQVYKTALIRAEDMETRFIRIYPGPENGDVKAELFTESLKTFNDYVALSYTWGNTSPSQVPHTIYLNSYPFEITENLWDGLKRLQRHFCTSKPISVWADAISINQGDTNEKNLVVPMMKDVYSTARVVIIWLGDGDELIDKTFQALEKISEQVENLPKFMQSQDDIRTIAETAEVDIETVAQGFVDVSNRSWFRRTWILQEVALPTTSPLVICGNSVLQWDRFIEALGYLHQFFVDEDEGKGRVMPQNLRTKIQGADGLNPRTPNVTYHIREHYHHWKGIIGGIPFMPLLEDTALCLCSEPRDKIYGFLALADDESRKRIEVDYNKPIQQVYAEAFELSVEGLQGFQTLSKAGLQFHTDPDTAWPSWLPNFDRCGEPSFLKLFAQEQRGRGSIYNASLGLPPVMKRDRNELYVFGLFVGEVESATPAYSQQAVPQSGSANRPTPHNQTSSWVRLEKAKSLLLLEQAGLESDDCYTENGHVVPNDDSLVCSGCIYEPALDSAPRTGEQLNVSVSYQGAPAEWEWKFVESTDKDHEITPIVPCIEGKPLKEAIWRTMIADHFAYLPWMEEGVPAPDSCSRAVLKYASHQSGRHDESVEKETTVDEDRVAQNAMVVALSGRCVLRTTNDWIGLGTVNTLPGDVVVVIAGADVPFILRPFGDRYRLVGEAFVEGLMFGELFEGDPVFTGEPHSDLQLEGFLLF